VAFPPEYVAEPDDLAGSNVKTQTSAEVEKSFAPAFLSLGKEAAGRRKPLFIGAIAVAVLGSVAAIGVPAGWYSKKPAPAPETVTQAPPPQTTQAEAPAQPQTPTAETSEPATEDAAALAAKRQREKERKAREAKLAENPGATPAEEVKSSAKRVVVTVTYDESGRVTQASGGDANALRIARQKRFPPGKAGSATVSIPIN